MQTNDSTYTLAVVVWIVIAGFIMLASWQRKNSGVGILINYLALMLVNYWALGAVLVLPYYHSYYPAYLVKQGFYQSLIGLIALGVGSLIIAPVLWKQHDERQKFVPPKPQPTAPQDDRLPIKYLVLGLLAFFVIVPITAYIPTLSAFSSNVGNLVQVGIVLVYWQAHRNGNRRLELLVLALASIWPIITVVTQGFLGFGTWLLMFVVMFVIRTDERPRRFLLPFLILGYLGLSVMITYMASRAEIRNIVWKSTPTMGERVQIVTDLVSDFQFFDITNERHLAIFDERFAYDYLTGLAMERINDRIVPYAAGETISNAFLMIIPRALWPDKPVRMGGDAVIFQYTGIDFLGNTTVQPPQVMEFYINFGTFGVVVGFMILGTLFALLDEAAARSLVAKNWSIAALILVPAVSLLRAEDSLIALVGGSVSGLITVIIVNEFLRILRHTHDDLKLKEAPLRTGRDVPYTRNTQEEIAG